MNMELNELYDKFIAEGCNRFYIDGIGGPLSDDVEHLGLNNGVWEVYYIERGKKSKPILSTINKEEAINFYYNHVIKIEHWHVVAFTRSLDMLNFYKNKLEKNGIRIIQNDIPSFKSTNDRVYRLFVTNKDIFKAKEIFEIVPFFDENLKY